MAQTENRKPVTTFLVFLTLLLLIVFSASLLAKKSPRDKTRIPETSRNRVSPTPQKTGIFCSRDEPYPNPAELTSAIALVEERIGSYLDENSPAKEIQDSTQNWLNCINARYKNLPEGLEGVFVFDENASLDNLQIFVDTNYKNYTDLLRAMLLSHELRHVFQFLQFVATGQDKSCVDKEVEAFLTQYLFFASLTESEKQSLTQSTKAHLTSPAYAPLISMHLTYQSARNACGGKGKACIRNELTNQLQTMILANPYYQQQCEL